MHVLKQSVKCSSFAYVCVKYCPLIHLFVLIMLGILYIQCF